MHQQGRLARRGEALERGGGHAHDYPPAAKARQDVAHRERALGGVELVSGLDQPGGRRRIEISAQRHDDDVAGKRAHVGVDAPGLRVDRADGGLDHPQSWLVDGPVGVKHLGGPPLAEHDVEFGEPEHEAVGLVHQDDVRVLAQRRGQRRRQFQAAKARPEHQNPGPAAHCVGREVTARAWYVVLCGPGRAGPAVRGSRSPGTGPGPTPATLGRAAAAGVRGRWAPLPRQKAGRGSARRTPRTGRRRRRWWPGRSRRAPRRWFSRRSPGGTPRSAAGPCP